jgi:hypothetical protein
LTRESTGEPPAAVTAHPDAGVRVTLTRGFEDVGALRGDWHVLESQSITTDFDYFHTVLASEPNMLEPVVLTVLRNEVPEAVVIARLEQVALSFKLGYKRIYEPSVRSLTVVYRGFRGQLDDETSVLLVRELTKVLGDGDVDVVIFRRLDTDHPLYRAATTEPRFLAAAPHRVATCWERTLPSFGRFSRRSKSTRSGVKRYVNKFERDFAGRMQVRRFTDRASSTSTFGTPTPSRRCPTNGGSASGCETTSHNA